MISLHNLHMQSGQISTAIIYITRGPIETRNAIQLGWFVSVSALESLEYSFDY